MQVLEAAFALLAVWLGLRTIGYSRTRRILDRSRPLEADQTMVAAQATDMAQKWAWSVAAAGRALPFSATCLHRTMALSWLLGCRGVASEIQIGAVRTESGLSAHAWLVSGGVVLNDETDVGERFAVLGRSPVRD